MLKLFKKRMITVPTWSGWLVILLFCLLIGYLSIKNTHDFLAVNKPVETNTVIVEGWLPDYALVECAEFIEKNNIEVVIVVGGPIARGASLDRFASFADYASYVLKINGISESKIITIPIDYVPRNRTYYQAMVLRNWNNRTGIFSSALIMTMSSHARRSLLLFDMAFPDNILLGVLPMENIHYTSDEWWKSSAGVRIVMSDMIAYFYAKFLFYPKNK